MMEYRYNEWGEDADVGVMSNGALGDEGCSICLHPISNPIGEECYLRHLETWLDSQGLNKFEIRKIRGEIKKRLPKNNSNQERCIACGNEYLSICSYCFVFLVSDILSKFSFARNFEEDFNAIFSYKGGEYDASEFS